jgi:hypothetical protein
MLSNKLACPQCRAVLKTNRTIPAGKTVKCPACGAAFVAGSTQIQAAVPTVPVAAPAPVFPAAAGSFASAPAGFGAASDAGAFAGLQPSRPALPARGGASPTVLALVVVGGLLFVGAGVTLAIVLLSGGPKDKPENNQAGLNPEPVRPTPPQRTEPRPQTRPPEKRESPELHVKKPEPRETTARSFLARADQKKVNAAIDRAVAFLKGSQRANGTWPAAGNKEELDHLSHFKAGFAALPGLTLLECGVPKDDAAVQKAAAYLRSREEPESEQKILTTYDLALTILFLDRLDDPNDKDLIRKLALRLVAGQSITGGWTYYCPYLKASENKALYSLLNKHKGLASSALDLKRIEESKLTLDGNLEVPASVKGLAVWRDDIVTLPNAAARQKDSDNSNTQFAVLALWAAKRHDLPLERTLALIVKRFRKGQDREDGSWGYLATGRETVIGVKHPTMTCAGLLGLAVGLGLANEARSAEGKGKATRAAQDRGVQMGLDVLAEAIGSPHQPWGKPKLIDLYFVWSVERVAVIYNLPKIGDKDWYGWGAEMLVANQAARGNWENGQYSHDTPTIDTCFALLFLKRANLARDLTSKLMLGD